MIFRPLMILMILFMVTACASLEEEVDQGEVIIQDVTPLNQDEMYGEQISEQGPIPGSSEDFVVNVGDRVFFGYDRYDLTAESQRALKFQAEWLNLYPNLSVTIEGHCDERGTREYNLALGERRANAVKNYLIALGVSPNRINTISYGKERPAVIGTGAAAWAQNRRGVTTLD